MKRPHLRDRGHDHPRADQDRPVPARSDREQDEISLDLVQRVVASVLALVVGGGIAVLLAAFTATNLGALPRGSVIGLWVMSGIAGLLTAAALLVINRRHPYAPLVVLGLLPMAVSALWVLT